MQKDTAVVTPNVKCWYVSVFTAVLVTIHSSRLGGRWVLRNFFLPFCHLLYALLPVGKQWAAARTQRRLHHTHHFHSLRTPLPPVVPIVPVFSVVWFFFDVPRLLLILTDVFFFLWQRVPCSREHASQPQVNEALAFHRRIVVVVVVVRLLAPLPQVFRTFLHSLFACLLGLQTLSSSKQQNHIIY
jgi:hypothetical protein